MSTRGKKRWRRSDGWTGPRDSDLDKSGVRLRAPVPPERWPYGLPEAHQECCILHTGGLFCDCLASDASEYEHGEQA